MEIGNQAPDGQQGGRRTEGGEVRDGCEPGVAVVFQYLVTGSGPQSKIKVPIVIEIGEGSTHGDGLIEGGARFTGPIDKLVFAEVLKEQGWGVVAKKHKVGV